MIAKEIPDDVDHDLVAELCERIEAAEEQREEKSAPEIPRHLWKKKGRKKQPPPADGLAYVTLTKQEWAAMVNPLGAVGEPTLRACRDAIATACKVAGGDRETLVTVWHPTVGFQALLNEVLRTGRGLRAAKKVSAQVYQTMGK